MGLRWAKLVWIYLSLCGVHSLYGVPKDEYGFSYAVADAYTGNQFGHSENRFGGDTVGAYHVLLPDGRLQTVSYTVDPYLGFKATVEYEGEANLYSPTSLAAPAYTHSNPAPYNPTPAPYNPAPAPYNPTPAPYYSTPAPLYDLPAPSYAAPGFSYSTPAPSYKPSYYAPSYSTPAPSYTPSYSPSYSTASPSYRSNYSPSYSTSAPSYSTPSPTYKTSSLPISPVHYSYSPYPSSSLSYSKPLYRSHVQHVQELQQEKHVENKNGGGTYFQPFYKEFQKQETHKKQEKHEKQEKQEPRSTEKDPYLVSEKDIEGKDFSGPFFYPLHRKIGKAVKHKTDNDI